jgi:protein O-mannosyl-transferase
LSQQKRLDEAIPHFEKAIAANPDYAEAHNALGGVLGMKGRFDEAVAHFERALRINPDFADAHLNVAEILYRVQGRVPEAVAHWRKVLQANPTHLVVLVRLARVLAVSPDAAVRNGMEAVALAQRAVELTGGRDPVVVDTLAAAYAEAGRFADAVETANRASVLAGRQGNQPLVEVLRTRVRLYQAGMPLRENRPPVRR